MGKLLMCACPDSRLHYCERFGKLQGVRAAKTLHISHHPHGVKKSYVPTLRCSDHCDLACPIPCPGAQCLCQRRHGLLLGNDPHRRLWHSLSLPSTPPSAAAIATAIATPFATAPLAAALTSTTLATAAFATASLTATTFATTLATTLATTAFATTFASRSHPHPGNCHPQRPHGHHLCRQRAD